jgi:hypothetical protein
MGSSWAWLWAHESALLITQPEASGANTGRAPGSDSSPQIRGARRGFELNSKANTGARAGDSAANTGRVVRDRDEPAEECEFTL